MKKVLVLCAVMSILSLPGYADLGVTSIQIDNLETNGFTASYNSSTRVLTWTGGASISFYNGGVDPVLTLDNNINLLATFQDMTDYSSGEVAKAEFEVVDWSISFNALPLLSGVNVDGEVFTEAEMPGRNGTDTGILNGDGIVQVTAGLLVNGWGYGSNNFNWIDTNWDGAKLKSTVLVGDAFDDYDTDSYSSINTTMWLYADETIVPEPATLILLGLGSLVTIRKRKV